MNKMKKILSESGNQLLKKRAEQLSNQIEIKQRRLVDDLYSEVLSLEGKLENVLDLSPDSRLSTQPASKDFEPETFVKQIQELKVQIRDRKIEYELAKETYDELFKDEEEDE
jgi:hypothetical protein